MCLSAVNRCEDIIADDPKGRAKLFLSAPNQPLEQAPFLRVIDSGDAAAQQVASIVLAMLIVVGLLLILVAKWSILAASTYLGTPLSKSLY